jgi:hypothetical protein
LIELFVSAQKAGKEIRCKVAIRLRSWETYSLLKYPGPASRDGTGSLIPSLTQGKADE